MHRRTVWSAGVVIAALTAALTGAAAQRAVASFQQDAQTTLQERLPAGFPVPAEAVEIEQRDDRKVECEVSGYTARTLTGYFREQLPKKGFTIVAQNPPRVSSYDVPVTLIFRTADGEMRSVQIRTDENGIVSFVVS